MSAEDIKDYIRLRLSDGAKPFRILGIRKGSKIDKSYVKPHGRKLSDGRVICWDRADDWKAVLMALHERTHGRRGVKPFAAVFLRAIGKYRETSIRTMIEAAAKKLGVGRVAWVEV